MKEITTPLIIVNFKAYPDVFGEKGIRLAKIAEKVSEEHGVSIAICPPLPYLVKYSEIFNIPVFSQKVDCITGKNGTGKISVKMIKASGASGTLINHSENRMILADLEEVVRNSRTHRLYTIICTNNEAVSAAAAKLDPHAVAFDPPELTGTGVSISVVQPEIIQNSVKRIKMENPRVSPFCGVGVLTPVDIEKALDMGIEGVIIDQIFVQAKDPHELLQNLVKSAIQ